MPEHFAQAWASLHQPNFSVRNAINCRSKHQCFSFLRLVALQNGRRRNEMRALSVSAADPLTAWKYAADEELNR